MKLDPTLLRPLVSTSIRCQGNTDPGCRFLQSVPVFQRLVRVLITREWLPHHTYPPHRHLQTPDITLTDDTPLGQVEVPKARQMGLETDHTITQDTHTVHHPMSFQGTG
jgi:hypothetical protein